MWMKGPANATLWRAVALAGASAALIVAVELDKLGLVLLSAHMGQHLLLSVIAPLLLVLARPKLTIGALVPPAHRQAMRRAAQAYGFTPMFRLATRPLPAWILFCGSLIVWHLPGPFGWTLRHDLVRMIATWSFFLAGLIFWEAVLAPARLRRLGHGTALLMVVSAAVVGSLPGALMTFAPRLLYPMDADTLAICGLTPLEDQELGGLVMWILMDAIFFAIAGWLFVAWLRAAERSANLRTAARASLPVLVCALAPLLLAGCNQKAAGSRAGGNPDHGIALIKQYGCGACHVIPGIRDANGAVGPPLTAMGRRVFIAGMLRNSPDNMMTWIQDPQSIIPGNAMPNMRIGRDDARDIASYLGTLQ